MNRLNKTKAERVVDHEQERVDRLKKENAEKRVAAAKKVCLLPRQINEVFLTMIIDLDYQRKEEEEIARQRAADKASRDYALLDVVDDEDIELDENGEPKQKSVQEMMDDFM